MKNCKIGFIKPERRANIGTSTFSSATLSCRIITNMSYVVIKDKSQFDVILSDKDKKFSVVYFTAAWCGPCKSISPLFEQLATNNPDYTFCKIDVDDNEELARHYKISAMPTFIVFEQETSIETIVGANRNALVKAVDDLSARVS